MYKSIKRFLALPVFSGDPEKTRLAYLIHVIAVSSLLAAAIYGFIAPPSRTPFAGLAIGVTLIAWAAMKGGRIREASVIIVAGIFLVVAIASAFAGGVTAPEYGAFIVPILFSGLLFGWKLSLAVTTASIVHGVVLLFAGRRLLLPQEPPNDLVTLWIIDSLYFILAGVFVSLAIQLINQALRNLQRELGERKLAEERLLQFRRTMDESNDALYIIDLETGRYLDFNRSAHESLGYSREELRRLSVLDVALHITSLDVWRERVELVEEKGGLIFETVYRRKDGSLFPVEVSARMLEHERSRVMIAIVRDVSGRKIVEETLRRRDATLEVVTFSAEKFLKTPNWRDIIDEVLQRLGTTIDATHAYLFEDHPGSDGEALTSMRYEWTAPGYPSDLDGQQYQNSPVHQEGFEEQVEQLSRGNVRMGTSATFNPIEKQLMDQVGVRSILEVPVFVNGREWGAIGFDDFEEEREWSAVEVDALKIAANVLGAAIKRQLDETVLQNELAQRKALNEELHIQGEESETLRESLASIAGRLEFSEIIEDILDQVKRVVPYDTATVWRINGQMQIYVAGRNVPPEVVADQIAFDISPENSAYPIFTGEVPYILNLNVQEELKDFQVPPHTYVKSWLGIPLKTRGQILGLIALDGREKNQFTPRHAALAATFANQVAIALDNSLLFSNLQSELAERKQIEINLRQRESILAVVAEAANLLLKTPNWKLEIDSILEKLGRTINASHAYICENHLDSAGAPVSSMMFEWTAPGFPSDLGNPLYQNVLLKEPDFESWYEIMNSGLPYIGDEGQLSREDLDFLFERGMKSLLDVPIFVDGSWWGTIGFDDMAVAREWTSAEVDGLRVAGNVLGAAIQRQKADADLRQSEQNYRKLYETAQKQAQELALLGNVRNAIAQELDLPALLRSVVESIADSFGYALVSLYLIKDDTLILQHQVGYERVIANIPLSEGVAGRVASTGKPLLLEDVRTEPGFLGAVGGIVSEICVPLMDEGRVVGILNVESTKGVRLTETDMKLLVASSEHIGIAIGRARLYSNVQGELEARKKAEIEREKLIAELEVKNIESETLRESVAIVTATLEKEEAINRILEQLERVVPYDSASVQLVNGNLLEIVSARGIPPGKGEGGDKFEINEEEPAYSVLLGMAPYLLFDDVQLISRTFVDYPHDKIHSWMAVPLKVKGQIIGIIVLDGYRVGQFIERHARLAVTYANQVAAALENARLYSDLQADLGIRQNLISELESKNAELERFTYTVSHDLKSPLFTIRGFLGYLERDVLAGDMDRLNNDIQRIADATDKMQHLLNDLLELSRIGRLMNEPQKVHFESLVREVLELLHGQLHERGVRVAVQENLPDVIGDRQRLLEVLQNLIENAVKFMGDQKEPVIEVGTSGMEDHKPVFFVRDNGMGIPPEQYERIFGLFNKLDPRSSGTGIGLALVRRIIEFHGGRIWVESEPGKGSTFYFTLPLDKERQQ